MTFPSRLTSEQKNEIVQAYMAGEPVASIAKRYGINSTYPGLIARQRGCVSRKSFPSRKRILVPPEIDAVDPAPSLADELGIKIYTHRVPNRTALTSSPIYDATAHHEISLPFVSDFWTPRRVA